MLVGVRLDRIEPAGMWGPVLVGKGIRDRDLEHSSGPTAPVEADLSTMILDNLLRYCEAKSAPFSLSIAHKWLKDKLLNQSWDAGAVIPDANLQAGGISGCGNHDLPRIWRNSLAGILNEVSD